MNRGGSSPSAAANYLICTNCRKVLRKVRARPGVRLERGASCGPGLGLLGLGAHSGRGSKGPRGTFPTPRPKKGAWVEGGGFILLLLLFISAGTDAIPEGMGIGGGGACVLFFGSSPYLETLGLLLGQRERGTCSILLPVLLMEVGVKSEQPGLVLRNLAPSSLWLTLAVLFLFTRLLLPSLRAFP